MHKARAFFFVCAGIFLLALASPASSCSGTNLALGAPATASASEPQNLPSRAFDGILDYGWNSGAYATQWIEADLGSDVEVSSVCLMVDMHPDGTVHHDVMGRTEHGDEVALGSYDGPASLWQWLTIPSQSSAAVRYVRVTTTSSPSWVAWCEVQVYGAVPTAAAHATWGALKTIYR